MNRRTLVIDRTASYNPEDRADYAIFDMLFPLKNAGHSPDLVWTISDHTFKDFEKFRRHAETEFRSNNENKEVPPYDFLRKKPIKTVDDLAKYLVIFTHHTYRNDDSTKVEEFSKKYPEIL